MVNPMELDPKMKFLSEGVAMKFEREWNWKFITGALCLRS